MMFLHKHFYSAYTLEKWTQYKWFLNTWNLYKFFSSIVSQLTFSLPLCNKMTSPPCSFSRFGCCSISWYQQQAQEFHPSNNQREKLIVTLAAITEQGLDLGHIPSCLLTEEVVNVHWDRVRLHCPSAWWGRGHPSGEESGGAQRAHEIHVNHVCLKWAVTGVQRVRDHPVWPQPKGKPTWHRPAPTGNSTFTTTTPTAALTQPRAAQLTLSCSSSQTHLVWRLHKWSIHPAQNLPAVSHISVVPPLWIRALGLPRLRDITDLAIPTLGLSRSWCPPPPCYHHLELTRKACTYLHTQTHTHNREPNHTANSQEQSLVL